LIVIQSGCTYDLGAEKDWNIKKYAHRNPRRLQSGTHAKELVKKTAIAGIFPKHLK